MDDMNSIPYILRRVSYKGSSVRSHNNYQLDENESIWKYTTFIYSNRLSIRWCRKMLEIRPAYCWMLTTNGAT